MKKILLLLALTLTSLVVNAQAKWYLSRQCCTQGTQPWGSASNINAMNLAFGVGNWNQGQYSTVNVNALLQPTVCFIFMEGGSLDATALNAFLVTNLPAIQTWVFNGGRLIINAAPNQGGNIQYGFGGVMLNYAFGPYSAPGNAMVPAHPIFNGPFLPVGLAYTGNWWCHGYVTGPGITGLVNGTTPGVSLATKPWGAGLAMFGSMTTANWHLPQPQANNFIANVITYMYVCCIQPTITAVANPTSICIGQSSTLTAGGAGIGGTYTWTPPAPGASVTGITAVFNPTITTTYTVAGTTTTGCVGNRTIQIVVNPNPTITTVASSNSVCLGQTNATVTLNGGVSYTTQPINFVGSPAIVSPAIPTTYTVTGVSINGCINTTTFQIGINPSTTATANNPTACVGTPINLTAGGGIGFVWVGPNGYTANVQSPSIPSASLNMTGQYTVIVTSALGCSNAAVSNVSVVALPVPNIASNGPVCTGGTLNLSGLGGGTYLWGGPNGFTSTAQTPSIGNVSLLANGIYSLVTTLNNCSAMITSSIVVNPLPTPILSNNSPVCLFSPITFTSTGGVSYTITGPNGYATNNPNAFIPVANNVAAGIYTLTATDINNCTNTITSNVVINQLPIISAVGSTVCAGKTITLSVSGGTAFVWSGPGGFVSNLPNILIPNATPGMSGTYTIDVVNVNGCVGKSGVNVVVNSLPTPTAGNISPVCIGGTINLTSGDPTGATDFSWFGPNNFYSDNQNPTVAGNQLSVGIYTVTAVNSGGCVGKAFTIISVNPLPNVSITSNITQGCVPVCINFNGITTSSLSYTWKIDGGVVSSNTSFNNCFKDPGTYVISASFIDQNGCSNVSGNYEINAYPIPVANFNFSPGRPIINDNIEFTDNSNGNIKEWTWFFTHQDKNTKLSQNVNANYVDAGTYPIALIVKTDKGCSDTITKAIIIGEDFDIFIPETFTPNGDGINDTFQPKGFGIVKYEMSVYDRWGSKIFFTTDMNQGWPGNVQNKSKDVVQDGVYVWRIQVTNVFGKSKEYVGHVSLLK